MSKPLVTISEAEVIEFTAKVIEKHGLKHLPSSHLLEREYGGYSIVTAVKHMGGMDELSNKMGLEKAPTGEGKCKKGSTKWDSILEDAVKRGLTVAELAVEQNTTMNTVTQRMRKHNIELQTARYSKPIPQTREEFEPDWIRLKGNLPVIANEYGVWDNTVRNWARKFKLMEKAKSYNKRCPNKWEGEIAGAEFILVAGAIVWKAMMDYIESVNNGDAFMKADCENFFKSDWGKSLVDVLPDYVQHRIEVLGLKYD